MTVLSGALLSGEAAQTTAKCAQTSGEAVRKIKTACPDSWLLQLPLSSTHFKILLKQSHSPAQTRLFRTTPPLWNLTTAGYPKCIPVDSPVPVQQADAHLDGSPLKNIAGSMGAGLLHPRAFFFFKYSHLFLSRNPRVQSLCGTGFFCDVSGIETKVQKAPRSPWNK